MSIFFGLYWNYWNIPTPVSDNVPSGRLGLELHESIFFGLYGNIPAPVSDNLPSGRPGLWLPVSISLWLVIKYPYS